MSRSSVAYERRESLAKRLAHPLRQVVSRAPAHPDYPFYQDEQLECGHTLGKRTASWRDGEWSWPTRRRCWLCPQQ